MKTYQIEIKNADKVAVKRFYFTSSEDTAYEIFSEWGARYDGMHKLEISDKRTGRLILEGRMSGTAEYTI